MFCCTLLYIPSSFAIILIKKREMFAALPCGAMGLSAVCDCGIS